jgi:hypothetical protein
MRATTCGRSSGMTIPEVMIMALVISTLMIVMTESMSTLSGVRVEQRAHFGVGDVADHVARRVQSDVHIAARVFTDTADDTDYLRSMAIGNQLLRGGRRLPRLTQGGFFRPDPADVPETGDVLFLARRCPRVRIEFDDGSARTVQVLQFVVDSTIVNNGQVELLRWISQPVVNYYDVVEIQDQSQRAEALQQLSRNDVHLAWDPFGKRAASLYEISNSALALLPMDHLVDGKEDADSRPFVMRHMQLAAGTSIPGVAIPAYANAASGFAGGIEIKVDGSSSGKLVLLRYVVLSTQPGMKRQIWTEIRRFLPTDG